MRATAMFKYGSASLALLLATPVTAKADQTQVEVTQTGSDTWEGTWEGEALRTYFVQFSFDLVTWEYAPVVKFGSGEQSTCLKLEGTSKIYMRLVCADSTGASTLQRAREMDFDGDKIPNYFEVEVLGTDPLDGASGAGDSDSDGLPDGWERCYFGNLSRNGTGDADGDGLSDSSELAAGTNPVVVDSDGDGIPDTWELQNGMNPLDPADAALDFDRDDHSNLEEFHLNTDPRGAPSFRIREVEAPPRRNERFVERVFLG